MEEKSKNQLKKERQMAREQIFKKMEIEKDKEKEIQAENLEHVSNDLDEAVSNLENNNIDVPTPPPSRAGIIKRIAFNWKNKSRKQKFLTLAFAGILFLGLGLFAIYGWWTGLDGKFIKSSMSGVIKVEGTGDPIDGVKILIDDELKGETNDVGKYNIGNLENGKVRLKLEKNGFETVERSIVIERYSNNRDFEMKSLPKGQLVGKLVFDRNYDPSLIEVSLGETTAQVEANGVFTTDEVYKGVYDLSILSPQFVDIKIKDYQILPGINEMEPVELTPAADITGEVLDWVTEKQIEGFSIEGLDNEIIVSDEGFMIKDIVNIGEVENFVFQKKDYLNTVKERKVQLGKNDLGRIFMYKDNHAVYQDQNSEMLYSILLNGSERTQVTSPGMSIDSYLLPVSSGEIYFELTGGDAGIYKTSLSGTGTSQVAAYTSSADSYVNYNAKKYVLVDFIDNTYVGTYHSFENNEGIEIFRSENKPEQVVISDNGGSVYYKLTTSGKEGIYRYIKEFETTRKLISGSDSNILAVDQSGTNLVFVKSNSIKRIDANTSRTFDIATGSPSLGVYLNGYIVYTTGDKIEVRTETGQAAGTVNAAGSIRKLYTGEDNYVYYQDAVGLKVIGSENPLADKLIY